MALVGQNGAGKSTLIKVLTGAYRRDGGEIVFDGRPIDFASPQEAQRGGISTIYQEINLVPFRSVAENIFLGRELAALRPARLAAHERRGGRELLRRFAIDIDVRRPLMDFSTAIQQMVAIARAVSFKARLVIMDEPTSSLDEREVAVLFDVIRQLKARGRRGDLRQPPARRALRGLRPRDRDARRPHRADAPMSEIDKLELVAAMLGRDLAAGRASARPASTAAAGTRRRRRCSRPRACRSAAGCATRALEVRAGEIVGLAGLLGSGRTETARAVFGADPPDAGAIRLMGEPVALREPRRRDRAAASASAREDRKVEGIVPDMSVRENLTLALLPRLVAMGVVDETRAARRSSTAS